ncbi:MAG: phosphoribosylanthranilate isomerase [Phycisphaerae bacterium]|nr:phosphoribosylanthranilate isomerase [Phycisphaerae bacterium]NIP51639.1 phosphoribosylanthranilate isomerase [Phycisphaerae bacterium]NIS50829.1 phosphoribosylanthranilate isomerase [Phycisphaerae bacterium]NIU08547.1 phosphoribosylanthranilate isomerase [Phycisphaerae bacterium]NIU56067.1 phosphoribosylanthranilate isomerase [Phycisphaerae bacterium]
MVKVKICGITNYEDAATALDMGADLLGFNFYKKSPRYVPPEKAQQIINMLPGFVDIAGVFVNESMERINETKNLCQLDWVQLHGDESPEFCKQFLSHNVKVMKAIRVKDRNDVQSAEDYFTDAILLDAFDPEKYGGTGLTFDWNVVGHINKRVFLAGGINPDNAAEAAELGVYGIDVCSGIEAEPGKKDHNKVKKLFENIRHLRG